MWIFLSSESFFTEELNIMNKGLLARNNSLEF